MLERMELIRAFDSLLPSLYTKGLVRGSSHAAIGQEAVAVGACFALEPGDQITSTHRGHGHAIAKGADVRRMMAELLGREDGYCRGKGGSMHIADFSVGMLGANGIVGGGFGLAGGAALSAQVLGNGRVVLCFFGDGAVNQGAFHEVANMASIWRLPLILLCENNGFAMSSRATEMVAGGSIARRAEGYGFPGVNVDGMDAMAVYEAVRAARARAAAGEGPTLLVADCARFAGHFSGDAQRYRSKDELAPWLERDPILGLRSALDLDSEAAGRLRAEAERRVAEALEFAIESEVPQAADAFADVYGNG